jgi:hypothetical protein
MLAYTVITVDLRMTDEKKIEKTMKNFVFVKY